MLATLKEVLEIAERTDTAVPGFNVTTLEGIRAAIEAAEERNRPVILQFANVVHSCFVPMDVIGPVAVELAKRAAIPVCVHLDHGTGIEEAKKALDLGFTGVMYDGSILDLKENVKNTREVVALAKQYGASVEGEIGAMGAETCGRKERATESCYTNPEMAQIFVEKTGVDALACSFGTVHGLYKQAPQLDFERIQKIRERTAIPIVMHGGSGIRKEDFQRCIAMGVRKINFYTYAVKYAAENVKEHWEKEENPVFYHDIALWGMESMKDTYIETINIFSGKI